MYVDHYSQWPVLNSHQCAAKILGVEDPRVTYDRFDIQMWQDKLQAELRASGLSGDTQRLAKKMVDSARVNALLSDADTVIRQLREIRLVYECVLLQCGLPSFD